MPILKVNINLTKIFDNLFFNYINNKFVCYHRTDHSADYIKINFNDETVCSVLKGKKVDVKETIN